MGLLSYFKNGFTNESQEGIEDNTNTNTRTINVSTSTTWNECDKHQIVWQLEYALNVVSNLLSAFMVNVDWKTYKKGKIVKGEEWFRFNIAPNRRETCAEFYRKLARQLIYKGQALIIETASGELYVADSYSFKNGQPLVMKDNTFVNVVLGQTTLSRTFKENDSCMFIQIPNFQDIEAVFSQMGDDFLKLKQLVYEGAQKALGMKLNLNLGAQAKNKYDEKFIEKIQQAYEPLMKARDAVFVSYKGETLDDMTERQRGSEVQQVLTAVENNIKINDEILCNVGMAYGIPQKFMKGDLTADNDSIYSMVITMFAKPYLTLLSKKFTYFVLTKDDIKDGGKVEADLNSIKFVEKLSMATSIDKLIGSGAYNRDEVREMLDDDPVEDGDGKTYFITKNYAVLSEYTKGGNQE